METGPLPSLSAAAVLGTSNNRANQHSSQWTHAHTHTQRYLVTFVGDRRSQIWSGSGETNGSSTSAEFGSIHPPPSAQPYLMLPLSACE